MRVADKQIQREMPFSAAAFCCLLHRTRPYISMPMLALVIQVLSSHRRNETKRSESCPGVGGRGDAVA